MTWQPAVLAGVYIQVNDPKGPVDLKNIISGEQYLDIIPSESFPQNRTLIYSMHKNDSIEIEVDTGDGNVVPLDDVNIQEEKARFERKFKKVFDVLKEHYNDVKIRYGIIHYWF